MLIIDAQTHVYSDDNNQYPSVPNPILPPDGYGSLSQLQFLAEQNGVTGLCVVQPRSCYGWDNQHICDIVKSSPKRMAAICSLDPDDSTSYETLGRYLRDYGIRGLRVYPASDGHVTHPGVWELWRAAGERKITINVLIDIQQVDELVLTLEKFPEQRVVIDHCFITKPSADVGCALKEMKRIARFSNTYAKLSFLPLGSNEEYPFRDLHDACKSIIEWFGAERCVWGSNFPCELWTPRSNYSQSLRLFTHEVSLCKAAREAILGKTAHDLWFREAR